jgi:hypothetical protein
VLWSGVRGGTGTGLYREFALETGDDGTTALETTTNTIELVLLVVGPRTAGARNHELGGRRRAIAPHICI